MPNTVRFDRHGFLLIADGYIWRPLFPIDYPGHPNGTRFDMGDRVTCRHRSGTPLASVNADGHNETWFSHGSYIKPDGKHRKSTDCYKPVAFTWPRVKEHA